MPDHRTSQLTDEEFLIQRRQMLFDKAVRELSEAKAKVEEFGWKVNITVEAPKNYKK